MSKEKELFGSDPDTLARSWDNNFFKDTESEQFKDLFYGMRNNFRLMAKAKQEIRSITEDRDRLERELAEIRRINHASWPAQ